MFNKIFSIFKKEMDLDVEVRKETDCSEMNINELLEMSKHWNGYKRESAVVALGLLGDPVALPALIERVNDWVPKIRNVSRNSILEIATKKNVFEFVENLPSFYKLKLCTRDQHEKFIEAIECYVTSSENSNVVVNRLRSSNPLVVRACVDLCINYNLLDRLSVSKIGLSHSDLIVRCRASGLMREFQGEAQQELLNVAISDGFMPIRREALQIFIALGAKDEFVAPYLFDKHFSIREIAIKRLADSGISVSEAYNGALDSKSAFTIRCGVWGVGALSEASSLAKIERLLTNPYSSVRKQAITTLSKLKPSVILDKIKLLLNDKSPSVAKEAARVARKLSVAFYSSELFKLIEGSSYKHTYTICFGISRKINKWERLIFLLEILKNQGKLNSFCLGDIEVEMKRWDVEYNRSSSQPSPEQVLVMNDLFSEVSGMIGKECRSKLNFTLGLLR